MSTDLVVFDGAATLVLEPSTGELVELHQATDRALLEAGKWLADDKRDKTAFSRTLAEEAVSRHGHGVKHAAGFEFKVEQTRSWAKLGTVDACRHLLRDGLITDAEFEDAVPYKRVPAAVKCKGLVERLMLSGELEAAKRLSDACSISAPRITGIAEEAVRGEAA